MVYFSDIHTHILWDVDDGAKTLEDTMMLLNATVADGTNLICLTPHYHPGYFPSNSEKIRGHYNELQAIVQEQYPSLELYLGNELRYSRKCIDWLNSGECLTLNGTNQVLVDFAENEENAVIVNGIREILNAGYRPVLAHAERYKKLSRDLRELYQMKGNGVVIQIDAASLFGGWGLSALRRSRKLVDSRLADLVCSDAHDLKDRKPGLAKAFQYVFRRCGRDYAEMAFCTYAKSVLNCETRGLIQNGKR